MAIAKMLKMRLAGINSEQDALLNALHSTGAVEIKQTEIFEGAERALSDKSEIDQKRELVEYALSVITAAAKEDKKGEQPVADGIAVSYADFMAIKQEEGEILKKAAAVKDATEQIARLKTEITALEAERATYLPYQNLRFAFSKYADTQKTRSRVGVVDGAGLTRLTAELETEPLCCVNEEGQYGSVYCISVIYHTEARERVEKLLAECAFSRCPHTGDLTAAQAIEQLQSAAENKQQEIEGMQRGLLNYVPDVYELKLLSDYLAFEREKAEVGDEFARTRNAFVLEGYVPAEREKEVVEKINGTSGNVYVEFEEIKEGDYAPTLMKNKGVASQFEFVTNLYSVPKYLSFDPNTVLTFFFSVFLGFITADFFYGLLMTVGGFIFARTRKRKTGVVKLANVIAIAGIPTMIFGIMFDSFLGIPLLQNANLLSAPILPDPIKDTSMLAGISVPSLLLICLGMGIIHIMTGLFINALIHFRHGRIFDGICEGFTWMIFLAGLLLLILSESGVLPGLTSVSAIVMVVGVVTGAVTAGRHAKGLGKITKGFGSVYGLINYMSDILSYARLYGLMLSGAQIAQIVSIQLALPMLTSPGGVGGVIACAAIMLVGHVFNIAMGLLGAFIHDARLQYVEFFSHFYEGDGELFRPMGTTFEHVYFK